MYEDDTTDAEGVLAVKNEEDKKTVMANGLEHKVPTPEVNDNVVNASVMLPIGNSYARGKVIEKKICRQECCWKGKQQPHI